MSGFETLLVEDRGPCRVITINRPKVLNALNPQVVAELSRAFEALRTAEGVRGVVLTGAGDKAFVAGADIAAMKDMSSQEAMVFASQGHAVGDMIANARVPVIAAVNGYALGGGCELALACDWIIASETATFGQPEVKLGVIPGFGGTQRLTRRVGKAMALELCITGRNVNATEALVLGLANSVVPPEDLMSAAEKTVGTIARTGPLAVAEAKRVIHAGAELPLDGANQVEVEAFAGLFDTEDQTEGMAAFIDKRKAAFKGE